MRWLRSVSNWGLCPQTPRIYRLPARIAVLLRNLGLRPPTPPHHCREAIAEGRRQTAPRVIPAAESALGLRPRIALSSAQVFPEWTTSTSPCNNFSPNGDYPLNFLSHVWGSLQSDPLSPRRTGQADFPTSGSPENLSSQACASSCTVVS